MNFIASSISTRFLILLMEKLTVCQWVQTPLSRRDSFGKEVATWPGTTFSALHPFGWGLMMRTNQWNLRRNVICQKHIFLLWPLFPHPLACVGIQGVFGRHVLKMVEPLSLDSWITTVPSPSALLTSNIHNIGHEQKKCFSWKPVKLWCLWVIATTGTLTKMNVFFIGE